MGRKLTNQELHEYAVINWRLAEQAEKEGNHELARELADIARDAVFLRLLDTAVVFGRSQEPHHVAAAQDQGFAVAPAFHRKTPAISVPVDRVDPGWRGRTQHGSRAHSG